MDIDRGYDRDQAQRGDGGVRRKTGRRVTYRSLAELTGLAKGTFEAMGSQFGYNATLETIEKVCRALEVTPGELLELIDVPNSNVEANAPIAANNSLRTRAKNKAAKE